MIKRARNHRQARPRLLVERPESQVIAVEIVQQGSHSAGKQAVRSALFRRQKIVVDTPESPDKSIQNVSRGRNDVLLKPQIATFIDECNPTFAEGVFEARVSPPGGIEIGTVTRFLVCPHQKRDALSLGQT